MTDESTLVYSANQAPVFSGNSDDLEEWILEVELWQFTTSLKEEKLAAKLITSQHDAMTKTVMLRVPKDTIKSKEGLANVLTCMMKYYGSTPEDLAWPHFQKYDTMIRQLKQTAQDFVLAYEMAYEKAKSTDPEISVSDRTLAMSALRRLNLVKSERASIIAHMVAKNNVTTRGIVNAIKTLYEGDVNQKDNAQQPKKDTMGTFQKEEMSFMAPEDGEINDDDDTALFMRNKNNKFRSTPSANGKICERCGKPNHEAKDCMLDWNKARASLKEATLGKPSTAFFTMPCNNCGDPNCEGWVYEDSDSDDDDGIIFSDVLEQ